VEFYFKVPKLEKFTVDLKVILSKASVEEEVQSDKFYQTQF